MCNLVVNLDLSQVSVVDRSRYRVTIEALGGSRCLEWPVSDLGVSEQVWSDICDWARLALSELLGSRKFSKIFIRKTNGRRRRGQKVSASWIEVVTGIVMPILYDGYILRNEVGEPLVENPVEVEQAIA